MELLKGGFSDIKKIFFKIKNRNFSGDSGGVIKNSAYQLITNISSKLGSLIFTAIMARILLPELFGLYSLTLSTILFFIGFTDLGITSTAVVFLSREFSKKFKPRIKSYFSYFLKKQIWLILLVALLLLLSSKFISDVYFQKPIFLGLIAGIFFLFFRSLIGFIRSIFQAQNDFKIPMFMEIIFEVLRIVVVPIMLIFLLKGMIGQEMIVFYIILSLAGVWFLTILGVLFFFRKKFSFSNLNEKELSKKDKISIRKVWTPLSLMVLAEVFFAYISIFIIGRFAVPEFIGYYQAAFSLLGSIIPIVTFSAVLFPLFSKLEKDKSKEALTRSLRLNLIGGTLVAVLTFLLAPVLITLVFGPDYQQSVLLLRVVSVLIVITPMTSIHAYYLISRKRSKEVAKSLLFSASINIALSLAMAFILAPYGQIYVVLGIIFASIVGKFLHLLILKIYEKRILN